MKKIFFTFLFLFLTSVSVDSFAANECAGTLKCSGLLAASCGTASAACTSTPAAGGNPFSCSNTAGKTCADLTGSACSLAGCYKVSSGDSNTNAFVTTMCNGLKIVTGNGGKAFAAFAIISVGIGFFTGKVSWGLMIGVTAGIAAMFGAPSIVAAITGEDAIDCGSSALK